MGASHEHLPEPGDVVSIDRSDAAPAVGPYAHGSPQQILALQRAAGNRAVGRQLARSRGRSRRPSREPAPRLARATPLPIAPPPTGMPGLPPPGFEPPPLPRIPGFGGGGMSWLGSAEATAEGAAAELGLAGAETVATGEVVAAGTTLGEGAMALAPEAAALATEVAAPAIAAETATILVGTTTVEGTVAVVTTEAVAGAALLTPVGWAIVGVVVVGVAIGATIYIVMSLEPPPPASASSSPRPGKGSMAPPRHAPGAPGGAPVRDPRPAAPAITPGANGSGPVEAPGPVVGPPITEPGPPAEPLQAGRPADLPSWNNATIDWEHVFDGHWDGTPLARGANPRRVGNNTMFNGLTKEQIQRVVRGAYGAVDEKLQTQDDRILVRGAYGGWVVEFWVNKATREIETAYPIFR